MLFSCLGLCLINRVCLKIPPFAQKIILTANGEPLGKRQILERLNAQRV